MRKFLCALLFAFLIVSPAAAVYYPPKPVVLPPGSHTCWGCAAGVTSFLGVVAALALYDFWRRTSCIGDPLRLGGPGFSEAMPPAGNIMVPAYLRGRCAARPKVLQTRG